MQDEMGEELEQSMDYPLSAETRPRRNWWQRTFRRLDQGSIHGSIFSLLSVIIGIGCLALPYIVHQSGLILGLSIIMVNGIIAYITIKCITLVADKYEIYHYPDLIRHLWGNILATIVDVVLLVNIYISIIAQQVSFGKFVPSLCTSFDIHYDESSEAIIAQIVALCTLIIPLGLFRKMSEIRYIAMFSSFSVTFLVLVVIIEFPFYIEKNNYRDIKYAEFNSDIFISFSISLFSYQCHINAPIIQGELVNTNTRRMDKVNIRSILGIFFAYSLLGAVGYLSLLDDTPTLIPNREPPDAISNDWAMIMAKTFVSLVTIFAVPPLLHPLRTIFCGTVLRIKERPSLFVHATVSIFLLVTSTIIAIIYPQIVVLLSVQGGIFGVFFSIIIPCKSYEALLVVKAFEIPVMSCKGALLVLSSLFFLAVGAAGVIASATKK